MIREEGCEYWSSATGTPKCYVVPICIAKDRQPLFIAAFEIRDSCHFYYPFFCQRCGSKAAKYERSLCSRLLGITINVFPRNVSK